jgi:hypothetical protein
LERIVLECGRVDWAIDRRGDDRARRLDLDEGGRRVHAVVVGMGCVRIPISERCRDHHANGEPRLAFRARHCLRTDGAYQAFAISLSPENLGR